jgi:hypothetical protein
MKDAIQLLAPVVAGLQQSVHRVSDLQDCVSGKPPFRRRFHPQISIVSS